MKRRTKKRIDPSQRFDPADYDDKAKFLIGWPGYRTACNKSGLGYLETRAEWAHMQGLMFRWLITGKFKTKNPVFLLLIVIHGIVLASPLLLLFAGAEGYSSFVRNAFIFLPYSFIGLLLLVNAVLNVIKCDPGESITGE